MTLLDRGWKISFHQNQGFPLHKTTWGPFQIGVLQLVWLRLSEEEWVFSLMMADTVDGPAKSCITNRMVETQTKSWDVYHRFQLVQDFAGPCPLCNGPLGIIAVIACHGCLHMARKSIWEAGRVSTFEKRHVHGCSPPVIHFFQAISNNHPCLARCEFYGKIIRIPQAEISCLGIATPLNQENVTLMWSWLEVEAHFEAAHHWNFLWHRDGWIGQLGKLKSWARFSKYKHQHMCIYNICIYI